MENVSPMSQCKDSRNLQKIFHYLHYESSKKHVICQHVWRLLLSFPVDELLSLCDLQVGESFPAHTQNLRALGESLCPLQSAWIMAHLLGANPLGAQGAGETATQTITAGATQQ